MSIAFSVVLSSRPGVGAVTLEVGAELGAGRGRVPGSSRGARSSHSPPAAGQVAGPGDDRTAHADGSRRHPVVLAEQERRAEDLQLRIADWITAFATLTLIVSLEAIFLSTFVMIGQNRQAAFQQAKADHDFNEQELELKTNTELTRQIHVLTTELHNRAAG